MTVACNCAISLTTFRLSRDLKLINDTNNNYAFLI